MQQIKISAMENFTKLSDIFLVVPVIKEKPKITKIMKKKTVVIECKVQSSFTPKCTWFKETKAVTQDSSHQIHIEQIKEVGCIS